MRMGRIPAFPVLACLLLFGTALPGSAQEDSPATPPDSARHPGEALTVYLMTIGQGDAVWEQFSHNSIWIQNEETGWSRAYNWGVFDFDQVDFYPRLFRGTMLYSMVSFDPGYSLEVNAYLDRAVWVQELALTPAQRADLLAFVEWNALPENKDYRYDYYRDNCSTRIRDALDRVLGGSIRESAEALSTSHTYRWHTRRLLPAFPGAYTGIQVVLGAVADRPLTGWEEMFLPIRLMEQIRDVEVPDGAGGMRPLVVQERQLLETSRTTIPTEAPFALPWFLLTGLFWGGAILALSRKGPALGWMGRSGLTVLAGGWAIAVAICGLLLLGAWALTDHVFWYRNLNLLQFNPLFLPIPVAFLIYLFKGVFPRWGRELAAALSVVAGVGFLIWLLPGQGQENGEILALTLPVNLSLAFGTFWLANGSGR